MKDVDLTHFSADGQARMVDVSEKGVTDREATAMASIWMNETTFDRVENGDIKKGDVRLVSQLAGIMGAKRTSELIPLCHPLPLTGIDLWFASDKVELRLDIFARVSCSGQTGVEMEALTAVSIAALTVYDMCKALQKDLKIGDIQLLEKSGGKSGDYRRL